MVKPKKPATAGAEPVPSSASGAEPEAPFRVVSWNVNGIRSVSTKGFATWLDASGADVVGLQETRVLPEQVDAALATLGAYDSHFHAGDRPGYSGVGFYTRHTFDRVDTRFGAQVLDDEGRLIVAEYGALTIVNGYFPNGSGKERDNSRVPYKLEFYRKLFDWLEPRRARGEPILVMGDLNTAHRPVDLARPKQNEKTSGFLPEEREELDRWLRSGWTDTFRHHEPGEGHYTWWSQRFGVREKNIGWRIDYVLASEAAMRFVKSAKIHPEVRGSDHCPISVELDRQVLTLPISRVRAELPPAPVRVPAPFVLESPPTAAPKKAKTAKAPAKTAKAPAKTAKAPAKGAAKARPRPVK